MSLLNYSQNELEAIPDRIDFIFNPTNRWKTSTIYIAVSNSSKVNEPVDFDIRVREYLPSDTYDETLTCWNTLFWDAFEGTDAHATSFKER